MNVDDGLEFLRGPQYELKTVSISVDAEFAHYVVDTYEGFWPKDTPARRLFIVANTIADHKGYLIPEAARIDVTWHPATCRYDITMKWWVNTEW